MNITLGPLLEESIKYLLLGVLAFVWRETRRFYRDVRQCQEDVVKLRQGFLVLANRDRKVFDFLRRTLYEMTNGPNESALRQLKAQVDLMRENAYRADEYRRGRESGEPTDIGDVDLAQLEK
jgi:hypothetical protein